MMRDEAVRAEQIRQEERQVAAKNLEALRQESKIREEELLKKIYADQEQVVSKELKNFLSSRSAVSRSVRKEVRVKLLFGSITKRVPERPETLELLRAEVKGYLDTDEEVKEYLMNSDQFTLTYEDDSKEMIKISKDRDLQAAYQDGLEAEGAILKILVSPDQ